ncbi:MAG: GxxExxY protein [Planctomycetota bacterium]
MFDSGKDPLTHRILGEAIEVHRELGPGLLESTYEACLAYELHARSLKVQSQIALPVRYRDQQLDAGYRVDLLVENQVVIELKSVDRVQPIHEAQLMTYLRLSGFKTGLLINFNVTRLMDGVTRRVL